MSTEILTFCGFDISRAVNARTLCFHEIHTSETIREDVFSPTLNRLRALNKNPPQSSVLLHSQTYRVEGLPGQRVNLDIVFPDNQVLFLGSVASEQCAAALKQKCLDDFDNYVEYIRTNTSGLEKFIGKNKPYGSKQAMIKRLQIEQKRREKMKKNAFLNLRQGFSMPVLGERLYDSVVKGEWQRFCMEFSFSRLADLPVRFFKDKSPETARKIICFMADISKEMARKQSSEEIARVFRSEVLGVLGLT